MPVPEPPPVTWMVVSGCFFMYSSAQRWPRTTIVSEPLIETVPAWAIAGAASDIAAVAIARIVVFVCMEQSPFGRLKINLGAIGRS